MITMDCRWYSPPGFQHNIIIWRTDNVIAELLFTNMVRLIWSCLIVRGWFCWGGFWFRAEIIVKSFYSMRWALICTTANLSGCTIGIINYVAKIHFATLSICRCNSDVKLFLLLIRLKKNSWFIRDITECADSNRVKITIDMVLVLLWRADFGALFCC